VILVVLGAGVGFSLITKTIPNDPDELFTEALSAAERNDPEPVQKNLALLKEFPDRDAECKVLEAVLLMGTARHLKAVPLLKEASEDPELRLKSLYLLGTAYASATDPRAALATFETILEEDENAHNARLSAARILSSITAWEEALQHLNRLDEENFDPTSVLQMRANIRSGLGQYAEAAADFEGAIAADPANPMNGEMSAQLVKCLSKTGNFEKIEEFLEGMDTPDREIAYAEMLLSRHDLKGAMNALEMVRGENPHDPDMNRVYARVMLEQGTPEKAMEAVANLQPLLTMAPRYAPLYRAFVDVARAAGETELASLAQQNVDLLDALEKEFHAKLLEVIKTREGIDARMELAELAKNAGNIEFARSVYSGLSQFYPERESEISDALQAMRVRQTQLVSTGTSDSTQKPSEEVPNETPQSDSTTEAPESPLP
jgi:tetratricopeptide (TPR) repeat protein